MGRVAWRDFKVVKVIRCQQFSLHDGEVEARCLCQAPCLDRLARGVALCDVADRQRHAYRAAARLAAISLPIPEFAPVTTARVSRQRKVAVRLSLWELTCIQYGPRILEKAKYLTSYARGGRWRRLGSVDAAGRPHVSPLWFIWDGQSMWFNSIIGSQRWANLERNPVVSVVVDAGSEYMDLRGVEVVGTVRVVGEVPRTGTPDKRLKAVEALFGAKYTKGPFVYDGRHAWLQLTPDKMMSWDFRKTGRP